MGLLLSSFHWLFSSPPTSVQLLFESLFNGVAIGSVLLVAALGLAIVFGLMGVINLAHGELIMLGAYTTYVVQLIFKLPALQPVYNLYVLVAIPIAFITSGVVGILLERTVIRRLYGNPLETLLATWGVSLILQQFVRSVPLAQAAGVVLALVLGFSLPLVLPQDLLQGPRSRWVRAGSWGVSALAGVLFGSVLASQISKIARATSRNVDVTAPKWMRGGIEFMDLTFPVPRLVIIVITILAVVGVTWFLNRSVWGMRIRAVTQNREMSDCLGIPTDTVDVLTFGIGYHGIEPNHPPASLVGGSTFLLARKFNRYLYFRFGPSPDGHGHIPLQYGMIGEDFG